MRWPWTLRRTLRRPPGATPPFGFAVVGLGHGATKFLEAVRHSPTVRVTALVSGDHPKAERLARSYGVLATYVYADFDRLADDPQVQAVYLCVPNALHRSFAARAARAGKHVLCEKPMAPTPADCRAMIAACHEANRLLMIGYRLPFTSVYARAHALLHGGTLGEVTALRSGFGFHAGPGWRLDPALAGGGSLFDVGIYAVNTLHSLFPGGFTVDRAALARAPNTQVEVSADWQGRLSTGAPIQCGSSFVAKIPDFFEVQTTLARLTLQPAFAYAGHRLRVRAHDAANRRLNLDLRAPRREPSAFRLEAEHLATCAGTGAPLRTPGEVGLRDLETLAEIERVAAG